MRRLPEVQADLLDAIQQHGNPVGSRAAASALRGRGHTISESTVSRMLSDLDTAGLTRAAGRKGRVLTEQGSRAVIDHHRLANLRDSSLAAASSITDVDALIDQLSCRRGIEREAARAAALRAGPSDLAKLTDVVDQAAGGALAERVAFHRQIVRISHNKQIQAVATTLFSDLVQPVERLLFLIGLKQDVLAQWADEHREIVAAIRAHDPGAAEQTVTRHLDCMIEQTERFADDNPTLLAALLAEAATS